MANKVIRISDLIHRVACSSCLTHRLPGSNTTTMHHDDVDNSDDDEQLPIESEDQITKQHYEEDQTLTLVGSSSSSSSSSESGSKGDVLEEDEKATEMMEKMKEMETLISEAFDAVSAMKKAYVNLQSAHSPWDPHRMRSADAAVVSELRRLARLRDRFRRGAPPSTAAPPPLSEVLAPYEATIADLRSQLKAKEAEMEGLKEQLISRTGNGGASTPKGSARKGRLSAHNSKRSSFSATPVAAPTPELFLKCMDEVKSATKSFTAHLLSLMRAARWDIAAAAHSIIKSSASGEDDLTIPAVDPAHAKHALESYVSRKIFHGFEHETFYIDGSLSSLLCPSDHRRSCLAQFRDMRAMDPAELLGIMPACSFGKFSAKKYISIVHPKMEESLFGGLDQRREVLAGDHPRTEFYGEYLRMAKAVWMLHLLAFALDPSPTHFEASKGAEFHPQYMESVVRYAGGREPGGSVVGFSVGPGFKLGNGSVVRARVYLVPRQRDVL